MMELISELLNYLGVMGLIKSASAILLLLVSAFFLSKWKTASRVRRKEVEIGDSIRAAPTLSDLETEDIDVFCRKSSSLELSTTAKKAVDSAREQDILDRALDRAYQNPDAPSGFGASPPPPHCAAPMTTPDAVVAPPIEEEETEIAIPQIVMPSPAAPEAESSHNSPLSSPELPLSLQEFTGAEEADDMATAIAKPSETADAADEARLEKPHAINLPQLATEQMFAGLSQQAHEPHSIEKTGESADTIEKKIDAVLKITTGKKKTSVITDQVSCSVFAPSQTSPSQSLMVQVFLHVDADLIKIREMALEADQGAERRLGTARLKTKIVRDAMIDIVLEGRGLAVDEKMQSLIWRGDAESVNFIVTMPEGNTRKDYFPIARLFIDGIPIGHIKFKLSAAPEQEETPIGFVSQDGSNHSTPQGIEERIYKRAFLSYSRKNFDKVSHFNEGLVHAGYRTFFDLESLSSGERWNDRIMQEIRECDVFYLFWTSQSKNSKWVDQETRYAHDLFISSGEKSPDIIPILFETPMPSPPDFISDLHFNSRHQLIRAGVSLSQG